MATPTTPIAPLTGSPTSGSRRGTFFSSKSRHSDVTNLLLYKKNALGGKGTKGILMIDKMNKDKENPKYIFRPVTEHKDLGHQIVDKSNTLKFFPDPPSFGVVCVGFKWKLKVLLGKKYDVHVLKNIDTSH